jgi:hypothetical protein
LITIVGNVAVYFRKKGDVMPGGESVEEKA